MKKTITKPDGSKEVLEGTPEEIAELERRMRQEPIREEPKKPGLLTEDDMTKRFNELIEEALKNKNYGPIQPFTLDQQWRCQHSPFCEIKVAERGWFSVIPPRCTCGLFIYPGERYSPILDVGTQPYRYTFTWTNVCKDCGMSLGGLNSNGLCNCARGEDGEVLEESNVEARMAYKRLGDSIVDVTKYSNESRCGNYVVQSSMWKGF